jgi:hypothetical protein
VPFIKLGNTYVNAVLGDGVYGIVGDHGPADFVLYCKLYDSISAPPLLVGAAQLTVLTVFWFDAADNITGAPGTVDGVAVFVTCVEFAGCDEYVPVPFKFTAATRK